MKSLRKVSYLILIFTIGCDPVSSIKGKEESNYPRILEKKSESEQQQLYSEYMENNSGLCAEIDEYGLNGSKICTSREFLRVEIKDEEKERMNMMAKEFLVRNQKFTNVFDEEQLEIDRSYGIKGCIKCDGSDGDMKNIHWKVRFKNQELEGLEVENTVIDVFLDSDRVYQVYGHWYKDVILPDEDEISIEEARSSLVGKSFTFSSWTGEQTYTITEDSFEEFGKDRGKIIFPYEADQKLEMRVCWVISANIWNFYLDSSTGEVIYKEMTVMF